MKIEKLQYQGYQDCLRISNDVVDLVVSAGFGPRILRYGFEGQHNEFAVLASDGAADSQDAWQIYGGHRFWVAPEDPRRTLVPDNDPVEVDELPDGLRLVRPADPISGMLRELEIRLAPSGTRVTVLHRLQNKSAAPISCAPWALSVMAAGGVGVVPHARRAPHDEANLLPTHSLALWPYTNMSDPRWHWGEKYIFLRQDQYRPASQKVGVHSPRGWTGYIRNGHFFVKQFAVDWGAAYPDQNASVELFACDWMLEVETLGPLVTLAPEAAAVHAEHWSLHENVPTPQNDLEMDEIVAAINGLE